MIKTTKSDILTMIQDQERIVENLSSEIRGNRSVVTDVLINVLPLHKNQLKILYAMLELIPE